MIRYIIYLALVLIFSCSSRQNNLPNIVLIIGDDHGWPYYGFMGNDIVKTPVLDSLANSGAVFTNGHVTSSICRPSLRTLLTGLYPIQFDNYLDSMKIEFTNSNEYQNQIENNFALAEYEHQIIKDFYTLPEMLRKKGYRSFEGGKYWEGTYEMGGFDDGMSSRSGKSLYKDYHILLAMAGGDGLKFARETQEPVYSFIKNNKEHPFFIWYAPMLPHTPFNPPENLLEIYNDLDISESAKVYYAMCTWFDRSLGEFLKFLRKEDELDNTLLIYINDNGWQQDPSNDYTKSLEYSTIGGPKGKKSLYDFGYRTPIIFSQKNGIKGGVRTDELVSSVDVFTTILDYADADQPRYLTGKSLVNLIKGGKNPVREKIITYLKSPRVPGDPWAKGKTGYSYRSKDWHSFWVPELDEINLYNIIDDPYELNEVSTKYSRKVTDIKKEITSWNKFIRSRKIFPNERF